MTGFVWPEQPEFAADSERRVFNALRRDLRDGDALLCGLRFTDPQQGDIEIDLTLFLEGLGVVVIEVKGGRVAYANGAWTSTSATGIHSIHPTNQARKAKYALRNAIQGSKNWSRGQLRDTWMLALPDTDVTENSQLAPDALRSAVIGRNDLPHALTHVSNYLSNLGPQGTGSAPGWIECALDILLRRGTQQRDIIAQAADHEAHIDRLTHDQARVLDLVGANQNLEIRGGAGSGKSWLAAEQARRWSAEGKRVALLSFGRGIAETFRAQFASRRRQHIPAFIGTFHQLGVEWGVVAQPDAPSIWWNETAPELMTVAADRLSDGHKFDAIVVDEAQDFADNWWVPLMAALREPDKARIATFRDDQQAVFGRLGHPEVTSSVVTLSENLRNTRQIARAFAPLIDTHPRLRGGEGLAVSFIDCATQDAVQRADDAAVALLDEGWDAADVALLTTQHRHPVQRERTETPIRPDAAHANPSGLIVAEVDYSSYWQDLWSGDDIFYATVAGFKGLERPAVVVAVDGFRDGVDPRELMYVAMSRARDKLVVVGDLAQLSEMGIRPTE